MQEPLSASPLRTVSLRTLTFGILVLAFAALAMGQWESTRWLYGAGVDRTEQGDAIARARHARDIALERASHLMNFAADNGQWDDLFNFMHGADPSLPDRVFVPESRRRMNLDFYAFVDPQFRIFRARQFDTSANRYAEPHADLLAALSPAGKILPRLDQNDGVQGFVRVGARIYAWGGGPILRSDNTGPVAGYLILFSEFDDAFRKAASRSVDADVTLVAEPAPRPESARFLGPNSEQIQVALPVGPMDGGEFLSIRVTKPRQMHFVATQASRYVLVSTLVSGALIASLALLFVERRLLRPVMRASGKMIDIGRSGDLSIRLESPEQADEIGSLVNATNAMLAQLESKHDAEAARDAAIRASELKSDFLARMSHEIRTPMNAVMGMTELLQGTDLTPRQRRLAETAHRSAESLLGVINDILDFSKIEAGRLGLVIAEFNVRDLAEETLELLAERAHAKGLELVLSVDEGVPHAVAGDAARLRQILTNLIGNAIKFTDRGEVSVRVFNKSLSGDRVVLEFCVADTGIGIAPALQAQIFNPFTQADDSSTRRYEGTGLGLAIARQLVELMGGDIAVSSRPGEGSTFRFGIPVDLRPYAPLAQPGDRPPAGLNVLIVDDSATNCEVLESQLSSAGAIVRCERGAAGALAELRRPADRRAYDLLITDRRMPGMDGDELVRAVRRDKSLASVRIVMLSSVDASDDSALIRGLDVDAYLTKPVRRRSLIEAVENALRHPQSTPDSVPGRNRRPEAPVDRLGLKVLLVEDNPVNREVAVGMLERLECTVTHADNGRKAVDLFEAASYDVVLMDCHMPVMDGYEATREIRRREKHHGRPAVRIIALTANAMPQDRDRCLLTGMNDFLAKPIALAELANALRRPEPAESIEPVFDPAVIGQLALIGKPGFIEKLIDHFQRDSARLLTEMKRIEDTDAARRAAHSLKSTSLQLGGRRLGALCRECESLLGMADTDAAMALVPKIEASLREFVELLVRHGRGMAA